MRSYNLLFVEAKGTMSSVLFLVLNGNSVCLEFRLKEKSVFFKIRICDANAKRQFILIYNGFYKTEKKSGKS